MEVSRATYQRARRRANSGSPRARVYARVLAPDPLYCGLCGGYIDKRLARTGPHVDPWSATVDHIVAVIEGGAELDPANLQPAHRQCNLDKEAERAARVHADGRAADERAEDVAWAGRLLAAVPRPPDVVVMRPVTAVDEDMP